MKLLPFKYDDGGRLMHGFRGLAADCVCRSVAIVTGKSYKEVHDEMALRSAQERKSKKRIRKSSPERGIYTESKWFRDYMAEIGMVWIPCMSIGSGCKVHLRNGELPNGKLVVSVSKHYTAVVNGVLRDTSDCSRGGNRCVYGFWKKAE